MLLWLALAIPCFVQDVEELKKEIEKLKLEKREAEAKNELLEKSVVENAETIQRLRIALKSLEAKIMGSAQKPSTPPPVLGPKPVQMIRARILHVDPKFGFVLIDKGRSDNLVAGYKFDIVRETFQNGSDESKVEIIGKAEFEKVIGDDGLTSKLKILDGNPLEMRADDLAVAIRALDPVKPVKEAELPPAPPGVYQVSGKIGQRGTLGYTLNYGANQGAHQTDLVWCYKDGQKKAKLRLDTVEKNFSVANVVTQEPNVGPPESGDQIFTRELNMSRPLGQVVMTDAKRQQVATDIRQREGIKLHQRLEIRRNGKKLGTLTVADVQVWGCWCKPEGELKLEDIEKGDVVEALDQK